MDCKHNDFSIGSSFREITNSAYCKIGNELNGTSCFKCKKKFVAKQNDPKTEHLVTVKNYVMACKNVNFCDFAYCKKCWIETTMSDSSDCRRCLKRKRI